MHHRISANIVKVIISAVLMSGWLPALATAQTQEPLRVVLDDSYPPYSFRSADGELEGILIDQWHEWERVTGLKVVLLGMQWKKAQSAILNGHADVIDTIFETPQRRKIYSFGPPYVAIDAAIFYNRKISGIARVSDLKGFRVAVKSGDADIDVLKAAGITDLVEYPDYQSIVHAAAAGKENIFCIDRPPALYYLYKLGLSNDFKSSVLIPGGHFHRAVLKGNERVLGAVENGFSKIPAVVYGKIKLKWFGERVPAFVNFNLLFTIGGVVFGVIAVFVMFIFIMRRRVADATSDLAEKIAELDRSNARNEAFIAALPDLFFTIDREGHYLDYSAAEAELLIAPPEQFLGKHMSEITSDAEVVTNALRAIETSLDEKRLVIIEYEAMTQVGSRMFEGRIVPLDSNRVILVARDISEMKKNESLLRRSISDREVLLREVHHRVKNNLQIISSLVSLQEGYHSDTKEPEFRRDTRVRIQSMAKLHELLYGSDNLASINPAAYIRSIVTMISRFFDYRLIDVSAEDDDLSIDDAMPFGLIVTELLTNAFKYAYQPEDKGVIIVRYNRSGEERLLEVRDNGRGAAADYALETSASLGFTLIRSLTSQLGGTLSVSETNPGVSSPGLRVVVSFPAHRNGRSKA